ncbi:Mu-like prophage FluMu protein gp29 [Magnetospirillum sp. XM-1]|uniref:DUF935 domain-containing protein n=1 Tax=Magnetospirillum sp. XM-1 TaxID=1663591 RepID=UPI00073DC892|nr:DUF935 domain-containing protein [Magnetospirillum sp. XM-1]CUW41131.1 Mu-like prophage FluMu protein gp29 [Magnetospirillum sp. XM-1]
MVKSSLVDQYGRPIEYGRLTEEESGPTLAGVRQILSDHPSSGLTPRRLASLLIAAEQGDADAYLELAEDMEEKDLHYRAVLGTRKLQVSQLPITVEAASDDAADQKMADLVREHLVESGVVEDYLFDMLDAVGKGYSVGEIIWRTDGGIWRPARVEWRDPRWFEFDRRDGRTLLLKGGAAGIGMPEPLKPFGYVVHCHRTKSGLPVRGGLARAVAWMYLFKNFDIKSWVEFLEVFGQPVRIGKYHAGASDADKAILLRAVRSIARDVAAIIPDSMAMELVEAKISGTITVQKEFAEFADSQVSKAVLGQTGTTDVGQHVGTAKAHDKVKDDIERDDARQGSNTVNDGLVRPLIDLNKGPQERYPRLRIRRPDAVDTKLFMANVKTFVDLGGKVEASVVRDRLGLPDPPEGKGVELLQPSRSGPAPAEPITDPVSTQSQEVAIRPADALDHLAEAALADWEPMMIAAISPVERLLAECATPEEFKRRLPEIIGAMDVDQLAETLAKACFAARAAGEAEAEIG